jgi:DNA polymerase
MGIDVWEERKAKSAETLSWEMLSQEALSCAQCSLCKTRKNVVFGVGDPQASLMIIGEAPGANEDAEGEPFVGRAGQLLNNMLKSIGLRRKDIYIANILKCRPPNNRDPLPEEMAQCTTYLKKQIELIQPKIIVSVGRISANFLLARNDSMSSLRGKLFAYENIPLFATYHPAYLLRAPLEKRKAYQDFIKLKTYLTSIAC